MHDMNEIYALLSIHQMVLAHGDMFPNIRSAVMEKLRTIEAEHGPQPVTLPEPVEPEEEKSDAA